MRDFSVILHEKWNAELAVCFCFSKFFLVGITDDQELLQVQKPLGNIMEFILDPGSIVFSNTLQRIRAEVLTIHLKHIAASF